ncbi:uncharacterized protein MEPE_00389 [Melanopsichium pennsylvanicum]|uniref:Rrp15p-domain-containing protein n=2 Tax=Melanopsichium pennsylvanicum TaxID=63383 RepID=A0AAJ4XFT4_9BASI|nr:conserved hypothetical protein [Melanopsichium pennsylvanicum 4]SNX81684.1 uncharacterized protein MEPE_00389 [Melanopsichium pennsylvanicum]
MAAGKFASGGSKMTMKASAAGSSRSRPSKQNGVTGKGKKPASVTQADSDSEGELDEDQISLEGDDEPDTEDEIEAAKGAGSKSKKTAKRKRRATSPTSFGNALEGLLGMAQSTPADDLDTLDEEAEELEADEDGGKTTKKKARITPKSGTQVPAILSLAPHLRRSAQSTTLSARAARIALEQKRRREERCHVKDVIGGWGPPGVLPPLEDEDGNVIEIFASAEDEAEKLQEFASQGGSQTYERKLRKVAQRGVVKLFNAIRAAQTTTEHDLEEVEAKQAAGKVKGAAAAGAPGAPSAKKAGLASKDARLADLSKSNFLDLIKKSSASKAKSSVTAK